jgi:ubiquinone/menaquinone biosynthesis C-methylase UbiE
MTNDMHQANMTRWNAWSKRWAEGADDRGTWRRCSSEPELVLTPREFHYLRNAAGKRVCVLGSGDNEVVFALAGLGADVTSVDISESQLDIAAARALELDLSISFVQSDVTDLAALDDASFDLVYTGGHVAVWVSDLRTFYAEAGRILKPGGLFLVSEYHPVRRVWKDTADALVVGSPYFERGPFRYVSSEDVPQHGTRVFESYEFHWTVADYMNAVIGAGCTIIEVDEAGDTKTSWETPPVDGLPEDLLIVSRKSAAE